MLAQSRNALALPAAAAAYPMAPRRARSCRDARSAEISLTRSNDTSASMTSKSAELEGECDELFELEPITVIEKLCKS